MAKMELSNYSQTNRADTALIKATSVWYKKWLGNILVTFASIAATFVVLEVLFIGFLPEPVMWLDPQETYIHHPFLIHQLKPDQTAFTHSFPVKTNSYGLRDHEFPLTPDGETFRILCIGDSLTFGVGVRLDDTYPKQLESLLDTNGERKYQVINAGVPAYDTWQEMAYLREYGWQFGPRLVILGFYANDIVPKPNEIPQIVTTYGTLRRYGLTDALPAHIAYFLKRSRVLLLLRDRVGKLINQINPSPEYSHKLAILTGGTDQFVERGWQEIETSFTELTHLQKKYGFDLLVIVFPMEDQLLKEYPEAKYQSRLNEIAQRHGIAILDLMPAFRRQFNGFASLFLEWDGHPNAGAHSIAAGEIKQYLVTNHLIPLGSKQ